MHLIDGSDLCVDEEDEDVARALWGAPSPALLATPDLGYVTLTEQGGGPVRISPAAVMYVAAQPELTGRL